jgi:hypothetical protein
LRELGHDGGQNEAPDELDADLPCRGASVRLDVGVGGTKCRELLTPRDVVHGADDEDNYSRYRDR